MPATRLLHEPGLDPLSEMEVPCALSELEAQLGCPGAALRMLGGGNCCRWSAYSRPLWQEPLCSLWSSVFVDACPGTSEPLQANGKDWWANKGWLCSLVGGGGHLARPLSRLEGKSDQVSIAFTEPLGESAWGLPGLLQ